MLNIIKLSLCIFIVSKASSNASFGDDDRMRDANYAPSSSSTNLPSSFQRQIEDVTRVIRKYCGKHLADCFYHRVAKKESLWELLNAKMFYSHHIHFFEKTIQDNRFMSGFREKIYNIHKETEKYIKHMLLNRETKSLEELTQDNRNRVDLNCIFMFGCGEPKLVSLMTEFFEEYRKYMKNVKEYKVCDKEGNELDTSGLSESENSFINMTPSMLKTIGISCIKEENGKLYRISLKRITVQGNVKYLVFDYEQNEAENALLRHQAESRFLSAEAENALFEETCIKKGFAHFFNFLYRIMSFRSLPQTKQNELRDQYFDARQNQIIDQYFSVQPDELKYQYFDARQNQIIAQYFAVQPDELKLERAIEILRINEEERVIKDNEIFTTLNRLNALYFLYGGQECSMLTLLAPRFANFPKNKEILDRIPIEEIVDGALKQFEQERMSFEKNIIELRKQIMKGSCAIPLLIEMENDLVKRLDQQKLLVNKNRTISYDFAKSLNGVEGKIASKYRGIFKNIVQYFVDIGPSGTKATNVHIIGYE